MAQPADEAAGSGLPDFLSLPFIPIPEVGTDPNSGTTLGLLPVFLTTDDKHQITEVIAPDIIRSPNFGWGARARIFAYPSEDTQWHAAAGGKRRVEREFDALYATGLTRQERWSGYARLVYDRSGTPRFYGFGNESLLGDAANYTYEQAFFGAGVGLNLSHSWQLSYEARPRFVDIEPGTLPRIASLDRAFPNLPGLGITHEFFNRFAVTYDTRDALTLPHRGTQFVAQLGFAERSLLSSTSYTVLSADFRDYRPIDEATTFVTHAALRYMPTARDAPFWSLSSLGGDRSFAGDQQPLRGFGTDRFVDRDLVSASGELRRKVLDLNLFSTEVSLELAPFVDAGCVFSRFAQISPGKLHTVGGLGFRAVASPFIVGYVDVGYGSEGFAVFSGINYPF